MSPAYTLAIIAYTQRGTGGKWTGEAEYVKDTMDREIGQYMTDNNLAEGDFFALPEMDDIPRDHLRAFLQLELENRRVGRPWDDLWVSRRVIEWWPGEYTWALSPNSTALALIDSYKKWRESVFTGEDQDFVTAVERFLVLDSGHSLAPDLKRKPK